MRRGTRPQAQGASRRRNSHLGRRGQETFRGISRTRSGHAHRMDGVLRRGCADRLRKNDGQRSGRREGPRAKRLATRPLLIGSGTNTENVVEFLQYADGIIVGSSLKKDGVMENPVDIERVRALMNKVRLLREAAAVPASVSRG